MRMRSSNATLQAPLPEQILPWESFAHGQMAKAQVPAGWPQSWETRSNFILQSECRLELGGPQHHSALVVRRQTLAHEERGLWLFGKELEQCASGSDFALLVDVDIDKADDELLYMITQNVGRYLLVKGTMVKSADGEIWLRVSDQALKAGLTFASWGAMLNERLQKAFAEIRATRIVFAVGEGAELESLLQAGESYRQHLRELKDLVWKRRGVDFKDCSTLAHCGQCSDRKLCANIRKIDREAEKKRIAIREKA